MFGFTRISKVSKQLCNIKVTPIIRKSIKKAKTDIAVHTYSGYYFPLNKNGQRKVQSSDEYQAHW